MISSKKINSIKPIILNGPYQLLPSIVNLMLSISVVKYTGSELWGKVVSYQLAYYLAGAVVAWGNKEYLLLQFSKGQTVISQVWNSSLYTRFLFLLCPILAVFFVIYPTSIAIHISIWVCSRFVAQSLEAVVVFEKSYLKALTAEIAPLLLVLLVGVGFFSLSETAVLWILSVSHLVRLLLSYVMYSGLFAKFQFVSNVNIIKDTFPFFLLSIIGFLQSKIDLFCMGILADNKSLGDYQVVTSYVFLFLLLPGFIITPYSKYLYRFGKETKNKVRLKLLLFCMIVAPLFLLACYWFIQHTYNLNINTSTYILAYLYLVSAFAVLIDIIDLYKLKKQQNVMWLSFASVAVNTGLCIILIPKFTIDGAMVANVVSQLFLIVGFKISLKRITTRTNEK